MRRQAWKTLPILVAALAALGAPSARAAGYVITKIALSGESAPGTGGSFDPNLYSLSLNQAGDVVFSSVLTVGGGPSFGLFAHRGAGLELVALRGDAAPGTGGGSYSYVGGASVVNDAGEISFLAYVTGGSSDRGLFLDSGGVQSPVVLAGEAAPPGGTYDPSGPDLDRHGLDGSGAVTFHSALAGATPTSGVFVGTPLGESSVALQGGSTPDGDTWAGFRYASGGASGHVVFVGDLVGGPPPPVGLFRYDGGVGSSLALSGDAAPGGGAGSFADFYYPATSASGDVAFLAALAGGAPTGGLFAHLGGALRAVVLENDSAPGTAGGSVTGLPAPAAIDGAGNVVFPAGITGGSVAGLVYRYEAASQTLAPVVFAGDAAPGTAGESFASFGTVATNDAGEVAFQATLSDGRQGIFLASPAQAGAAVPGLGAVGLAAAALLFGSTGLMALRRRARPSA